jgi:hypothetical protein
VAKAIRKTIALAMKPRKATPPAQPSEATTGTRKANEDPHMIATQAYMLSWRGVINRLYPHNY